MDAHRLPVGDDAALARGHRARRSTWPADEADLDRILVAGAKGGLSDERFIELDVELHQAVVRGAKNRLLAKLYASLEPLMLEYSRRVIAMPGRRETAHHGHELIVEAVKSGDPQAARRAVLAHIHDVENDITQYLSQSD